MKVSQIPMEQLTELSIEAITKIVYGGEAEKLEKCCAALVLGGNPRALMERAEAAAELYHRGLVEYLLPTGGVKWDTDRGRMSEAEYLTMLLENLQVPAEAILMENQATTTRENMIYCTLLMERRIKPRGNYGVYIVTSPSHLRRSMVLAKLYMPRNAALLGHASASSPGAADVWHLDDFQTLRTHRELKEIKKTIDHGDMEDIEV